MNDLISSEELPKWVPGRLFVSSDEHDWKGVKCRGFRYQGLDVEIPPMRDFMVVSYRQGATRMDRKFDGPWNSTRCAPGDVSLLTRSQQSHWTWPDPIDVLHVYLSEQMVSRVVNEVMERSVTEVRLHDVLRTTNPTISTLVDAIAREAEQPSIGGALYVEALSIQLVVCLLRDYTSVTLHQKVDRGRLSPAQLRRVFDYIDAHLDGSISLEAMAAEVNMGAWSFSQRFRATAEQTPHAFVIDRRIRQACQLLKTDSLAIKQVASVCGFSDQAHMSKCFRAKLNITPAAFRRSASSTPG